MKLQKLIIEGNNHITSPGEIATTLNRQYIAKIRKIVNETLTPWNCTQEWSVM